MIPYVGNSYYCYADATAMLLAASGESIPDTIIEVLCGVGLGAMWNSRFNMIFFSNLASPPDVGISQALDLLGFRFTEKSSEETAPPPFEALRVSLEQSPAILGPLDMGFLRYNPECPYLKGADHYVLAYHMDDREIYLHDPLGFPHVALTLKGLAPAWKAKRVAYHRGSYRYWTALQRYTHPSEEELYVRAVQAFKVAYQTSEHIAAHEPWAKGWTTGREGILKCAHRIRSGHVTQKLKGHLCFFMLRLSARRALDFASFFSPRTPALAALKRKQAELFGRSHTLAVRENWADLADTLQELADVEEEFRTALLNY
jgi:hypothetical protein